jgi:phage-related protein
MNPKPLIWVGTARDALRHFPSDARRRAGHELHLIQHGLHPTDFKPIPTVGARVYELRVRAKGAFRIFYLVQPEAIYVLHAFRKAARKTPRLDLEIGRKRFRDITNVR